MTERTDVERLMGGQFRDPEVQAILARHDAAPVVEDSDGQITWVSRSAGLEVHADSTSGRITVVFTYGDADKFQRFGGTLPDGVPITASREQVRQQLGPPDKSGKAHDFWQRDDYDISVVYTPAGTIKTFTLMS